MSFGGFTSKISSSVSGGSSGGGMVADGLCSYNIGTAVSISQPAQVVHSSVSQPLLFNSSPLSLALQQPKMENLGGMGLIGESYDSGLLRTREDEFDSRSGSDNLEAASGDDGNNNTAGNKSSKRKKYHRHTAFQIQELENAFKENPHPDEKARLDLGRRLSLEGRQIKFWFQNRRTQMKTQLERHENSILKQENDKLRMENITMKEAMRNPICENCGSPAILGEIPIEHHHLLIENARLKDELNRLGILASKFLSRDSGLAPPTMCNSKMDAGIGQLGFNVLNSVDPTLPLGLDFGGNRTASNAFPAMPPSGPAMSMSNAHAPVDKSLFMELAMVAIDELIKLARPDCLVWFRSTEGSGQSLNLEEYNRTFSPCIGVKPNHFVTEATRATGSVMINSMVLMETLMDVNQWMEMFPWIISQASTLEVISHGMAGNRNGSLQLMQAEFQILSPMVPVRQVKFIRFCKRLGEDTWAVVDVSIDALLGNTPVSCRRRPSGCIVQDMPDGCCKVTWVEHTEYDENIIHHFYRSLVMSGLAFGAQRWVASLQRQCELFAVILSSVATGGDHPAIPPSGKKSIVKLAQRMSRSFCIGVCSTVHKWEVVQDADNTKLMMRKSTGNSGEPPGIILSATTTVWMPVSPQHLFNFLQNEKTREHWDVLSQDGPMQQVLDISKDGQGNGNSISLLHTDVLATNANQRSVLILQDASTDASGSLIVHAAVDTAGMNAVMSGSDPSGVAILPSGFAIIPDCLPDSSRPINNSSEGSLLTVGFQILVNNLPAAKITMESVDTVKSLIARTLQGIKTGVQCA